MKHTHQNKTFIIYLRHGERQITHQMVFPLNHSGRSYSKIDYEAVPVDEQAEIQEDIEEDDPQVEECESGMPIDEHLSYEDDMFGFN